MSSNEPRDKSTSASGFTPNVLGRITQFADQRMNAKRNAEHPAENLEPTVIPAPTRGHTWSPDMLRNLGQEDDQQTVEDTSASAEPDVDNQTTSNDLATSTTSAAPNHANAGPTMVPTPLSHRTQPDSLDARLQAGGDSPAHPNSRAQDSES